jgi:hypothetical protein
MTYTIWSHSYIYEDDVVRTTCNVPMAEWQRIHAENPDARRIFARCVLAGGHEVVCALGEPAPASAAVTEGDGINIFFPLWLLGEGPSPIGENFEIDWISDEYFPAATRIVLRPHDTAFYHANTKNELEYSLTQYGVLRKGTTIPIEIQALGSYRIDFDVILTEPADLVLMEGDEVEIEFENALDELANEPAAVAITEESPIIAPQIPDLPLLPDMPMLAAGQVQGQALGTDKNRPMLPDGRPWNPWR